MENPPLRVSLVTFPETDPSILFGVFDTLWSAGRLWNALQGLPPAAPAFEPRIVGAEQGPLGLVTGPTIVTQDGIDDVDRCDMVFVPNVLVDGAPGLRRLDRRLLAGIERLYAGGAAAFASCAGALALAETGLLDGHEATTHWAYADLFRQQFPAVTLHADRILVQSGPDQRIVSSGGAASWQDLVLFLVAKYVSMEESIRLSKVFLYQWHREGQLPYASMMRSVCRDDPLVADLQAWIAYNYGLPNLVAAVLQRSGLAETTFKRRFKAATGFTPIAYIQMLRVEEAKQMLETGGLTVDAVGREVGYEDTAYFRKLFAKLTGMRPSDYRRKFRPPEMVLHACRPERSRGGAEARREAVESM